jgi:hypothetical protein
VSIAAGVVTGLCLVLVGQNPATHSGIALFGVWRDVLSLRRKTELQSVHDNNAARVAGPGRICFFRMEEWSDGVPAAGFKAHRV